MRNTYLTREDKKLMKPVIEKRRRDRINQSLDHLRTLLLEATHDESLKNPKTEKADILKKTVQFLKLCHNPGSEDGKTTIKASGFKGGFQEGMSQATSFLSSTGNICGKKRDYVVEKLCQHMEARSPKKWKESLADDSFRVDQRQLIQSPPQISRLPEDTLKTSSESHSCQSFLHYPSPPSATETPYFEQVQQSSTHKVQPNSYRKSVQRTLFPPSASISSLAPSVVWRPWP
ncbi:transcription factor HES-4-like isoform X2 [Mixophyes fleayi]|uniref:transcription factor HES-4-like isoform X2 n=1 Tax=Mixophyes fleayi TaxID=3061075 RepID=UPI003F4DA3A0